MTPVPCNVVCHPYPLLTSLFTYHRRLPIGQLATKGVELHLTPLNRKRRGVSSQIDSGGGRGRGRGWMEDRFPCQVTKQGTYCPDD